MPLEAVFCAGSLMGAINFIATTVDLRTKDFNASKLDDLLELYKLAVIP